MSIFRRTGPHRNTLLARFRFTLLHGFGLARCRSARHGHVHTVNTVVPESVRLRWKQFNMFKISGGRSSRCGFCGPIWLPQTLMTCHLSGWLVITALITGCVWLDQVRWDLWQVQLQLRMPCIPKNWSNNLIHQDVFIICWAEPTRSPLRYTRSSRGLCSEGWARTRSGPARELCDTSFRNILFKTNTYWQLVSFQNGASGIHIFSHTSWFVGKLQ